MVTESGCGVILGDYSHSQQSMPELWDKMEIGNFQILDSVWTRFSMNHTGRKRYRTVLEYSADI